MLKSFYKNVYWAGIISSIPALYFLIGEPASIDGCFALLLFALCGIFVLFFTIKIFNSLPGKMNTLALIGGLFLIIGGTIFDIANTVIYSPDLELEANPIIQFFIQYNFSLKKIYFFAFIYQVCNTLLTSFLWASFLKAYPTIIKSLPKKNIWKTTVFIFAGPKATSFDFIVGKVDPFYFITSITPVLTALSLYRWYLGLEWLELVPISRILMPFFVAVLSIFYYIYFSYKHARKYAT